MARGELLMAVDKLVDSTQLDSDLTSVADAIRTKGGTNGSLAFPAGFVSAIEDIETGGGGWTMQEVLESEEYASLWTASQATLKIVNPYITKIVNSMFSNVKLIKSINFPNVKAWGYPEYLLRDSAVEIAVFPQANSSIATSSFRNAPSLTAVDFGPDVPSIGNYFISNSPNVNVIILRRTTSVVTISNASGAISGSPFADGKAGGTLYVPSSLISSYQAATNWSTILGYANNQILPIEGSVYENAYADGTPIT
jgi:hypothetical protein